MDHKMRINMSREITLTCDNCGAPIDRSIIPTTNDVHNRTMFPAGEDQCGKDTDNGRSLVIFVYDLCYECLLDTMNILSISIYSELGKAKYVEFIKRYKITRPKTVEIFRL